MRLAAAELRQLAHGCCEVREEAGGLFFDRMNEGLREYYGQAEGSQIRAQSPAGVRLRFRTDASGVTVAFRYGRRARAIFGADLLVDGDFTGTAGPVEAAEEWSGEAFAAVSNAEREFDLWLPYAVETWVEALELDDGAQAVPVPAERATWLAVGDSITQGIEVSSPSRTYAAVAARALRVNLHNLGVGGAQMAQPVGKAAAGIACDFATVAFGVNDWSKGKSPQQFEDDALGLLTELVRGRETLPVGLMTPLPVFGRSTVNDSGVELEAFREVLRNVAERFTNVRLIEGASLVSAVPDRFVDGVHPNDAGMAEIGSRLRQVLSPIVEAAGHDDVHG